MVLLFSILIEYQMLENEAIASLMRTKLIKINEDLKIYQINIAF
jgi:hypothetical protein